MSQGVARRLTVSGYLRRVGDYEHNVFHLEEQFRDGAGVRMDDAIRDIRHAIRLMSSHRAFAGAAVLTIALAVGGTASVFAVVYGVLLRPLPYPEPERLVRVWEVHPGGQAPIPGFKLSGPTYRAWSRSPATMQAIAAFGGRDYTVTTGDVSQRLRGTRVTPSLFRVLSVSPLIGRFFGDADANEGAQPVVLLSHSLWRERFGGDPEAIGRTLTLGGVDHTIVGVARPGFAFPDREVGLRDDRQEIRLYTPLAVQQSPGARVIDFTDAIARLKPGVTVAQVEAEGQSFARGVERPLADLVFGTGNPVEVRVRSLTDQMTMSVRPALEVLSAAVALVLLIACANLANLFLSRASDRTREMAVRSALGAARTRLIRQLLTESLVISLIGGSLGLLAGWAFTSAVPVLAPTDFPRLDQIRVDAGFVIVAALAAVFVGMVAGILPAVRGSRLHVAAWIEAGGARSVGSGRRLRRILLALEAAFAIVLLVGAALLARSFAELVRVDPGYEPTGVVTAELRFPSAGTTADASLVAASIVERLQAMPAVRAAGAGDMAPFGSMLSGFSFSLPGVAGPDSRPVTANALRAVITPGYAEALGMRLKEGRLFRNHDLTSAIRPILVNESFAKSYFTDGRPHTGRRFTGLFPNWLGKDTVVEVVGVVGDMLPADFDQRPQPQIFVCQGAGAQIGQVTVVVKSDGEPLAMAAWLRDVVRQLEPRATVERMGPLEARISASVSGPRFTTAALAAFALLALALASTGLYGVLTYDITQRRRELGVRTALGATPGALVRTIMREGLLSVGTGLGIGILLATIVTRAMESALFGVTPLDVRAFSAAPVLLFVVACVACVIPARRAAAIDPADALRAE